MDFLVHIEFPVVNVYSHNMKSIYFITYFEVSPMVLGNIDEVCFKAFLKHFEICFKEEHVEKRGIEPQ